MYGNLNCEVSFLDEKAALFEFNVRVNSRRCLIRLFATLLGNDLLTLQCHLELNTRHCRLAEVQKDNQLVADLIVGFVYSYFDNIPLRNCHVIGV